MKFKLAVVALVGIALAGAFRAVSAQEKTQWDGIYTAEQAKRGETVYQRFVRAMSWSRSGRDDLAPALTGADFAIELERHEIGDLFDRVSQTMPLSAPGSLTAPQYADVVWFILQKSGAPAGTTELPTKKDALTSIKFAAKKP